MTGMPNSSQNLAPLDFPPFKGSSMTCGSARRTSKRPQAMAYGEMWSRGTWLHIGDEPH